jgi:uncharacterized protein YkwD
VGRILRIGWGLILLQAGGDPLDQLRGIVVQAYERRALPPPAWDPTLATVAAEVANSTEAQLGGTLALRSRLQAHGLGDPAPSGLWLEGATTADLLGTLRHDIPVDLEPATQFGAALSTGKGAGVRLVLLRVRRKAEMAPLPAAPALSETIHLRGRLLGDLREPSCYAESPDGIVTRLPTRADGPRFEAAIEPRVPGRYVVEVMAEGSAGPEIAWIAEIRVGELPPAPSPPRAAASDPALSPEEQVLRAINAERVRQGEPALALDPQLSDLARAYSEELSALRLLVHRSPRSGDLVHRLQVAGYGFQRAGENLGEGITPIEAQAMIASSPAHRRNLIDPGFDRCGIGLARPAGARSVVLTEIFAGGDAPR